MLLWLWLALCPFGVNSLSYDYYDEFDFGDDDGNGFVEDLLPTFSNEQKQAISKNRASDSHRPSHCKGVCLQEETDDDYGLHIWGNTSVGFRRFVSCNYDMNADYMTYAQRDCLLDEYGRGVWSNAVNYSECSKTPLVVLQEEWSQLRPLLNFRIWVTGGFEMALANFDQHLSIAVTPHANETFLVFKIAYYVINAYSQLHSQISFHELIDLLGFLLDANFVPAIKKQPELAFYVNTIVNKLPQIAMRYGPADSWLGTQTKTLTYCSGNIGNTSQTINVDTGTTIYVQPCVDCSYQYSALVINSDVIAEIKNTLRREPEVPSNLGVDYFDKRMYYITAHNFQGNTSESHPQVVTSYTDTKLRDPRCVWDLEENANWQIWPAEVAPCVLTESENKLATCQCNGTGYFGIAHTLISDQLYYLSQEDSTTPAISQIHHTPENDILKEYSYKYDQWVIGTTLQSISLLCLLSTVCLLIFARRLRGSRSAMILLNLCASIIGVEVVVFAAELTTDSRLGCTLSNILRYYFIMVSLLWNATEAHSLRVQMFSESETRFMVVAAVLSWGLPMLAIGAVLAVDVSAFDGLYVDCTFRCIMKYEVVLYAHVVPIACIALHNWAAFGFVSRLLCLPRELTDFSDDLRCEDGGLSCRRVSGGYALLALLAFPWGFSAFVALDVSKVNQHLKQSEALYQIIFLSGVVLQSIFIFAFYNLELRVLKKQQLSSRSSHTEVSKVLAKKF
ncbi:hypothetical protein CAPTEDRAFT_227623 [Capitella teleta]|uniref:G-protein coupled receptors family 2 profile 2 domain-containing protein n=1 Tax=Capitella teleta TaxID=283909 RepID=R7VIK6_CAPTE|nr:hypothetical protein CAPTEDRAFT_227623 [Capitella teleta]|eukprot:ELU18382.1 hypothetical protein CAPTEDRAFT_227623 [Capitella teleta]